MNSAAVVNDVPEQAMSFGDYYYENNGVWATREPDNFAVKFIDTLSGKRGRLEKEYQTYLDNLNLRNEAKAVQSARAYDEFMSNTAYSRAFEDLNRSGVNPYLLLNSGSTPSTSVGSSIKGSYASKSSVKDTQSNNKGRDFALILLAIARLVAAL